MKDRMVSQKEAQYFRKRMVGSFYRHFKGGVYEVVDIAVHSETAECMVIYKSAILPEKIWCRPLDMFLSPVDREKYPNVEQTMRFQYIRSTDER